MTQSGHSSPLDRFYATPGMRRYELKCRATVNGRTIEVVTMVDADMYDSMPGAREFADNTVRYKLINAIMEEWKPVVHRSQ